MNKLLTGSVLALAALALAPAPARADWGIRLGLEAPLVTHDSDRGSNTISDGLKPAIDLLVLKGPNDFIGFGLEGHVGFASTGAATTLSQRTGTSIGPTMIINVPLLPIYARIALPVRIEPSAPAVDLRLAGGLKLNLPFVGLYLELAADSPLAGKYNDGSDGKLFARQIISLGAGAEVRF